jgi:hypothetical protein
MEPAMRVAASPAAPAARPRYSALAFRAFDLALAPWRATHLHRAPIPALPVGLPDDRPLLLVANHTSWWDGFLLRDVHRLLRPRSPMYTVMTRTELERRPLFRHLGCVPVEPGSPSSLLALLRGLRAAVARRPDASIVYFPQGRIWPSSRRPLGFLRGVELVARAVAPCHVLPIALHVEPLQRAAATAFVLPGRPVAWPGDGATVGTLERTVTDRLDSLARFLSEHGESAVQHIAELP